MQLMYFFFYPLQNQLWFQQTHHQRSIVIVFGGGNLIDQTKVGWMAEWLNGRRVDEEKKEVKQKCKKKSRGNCPKKNQIGDSHHAFFDVELPHNSSLKSGGENTKTHTSVPMELLFYKYKIEIWRYAREVEKCIQNMNQCWTYKYF